MTEDHEKAARPFFSGQAFRAVTKKPSSQAQKGIVPEKIEGFSIETKVVVFGVTAFVISMFSNPLMVIALSTSLLVFLALDGQRHLAKRFTVFYAVLMLLYVLVMYLEVRFYLLSPMHIFMAWKAYPGFLAAIALVTSPPGMISSFLARLHMPKKAIVGTLVVFRFFPTTGAAFRRLSESMKNRGLLNLAQIVRNPLDTLEYLFVPIMMALVNSADHLSSSAITRAAEAPTKRTSYYQRAQGAPDYVLQVFCLTCLLAVLAVLIVGALN